MFENALFAIISHFKGVNVPFVFGLKATAKVAF